MKMLINGPELAAATPWLVKVTDPQVASRGGILITAGECVEMSATNGESFATVTPPATVLDEGAVLVSGRGLAAIAKEVGKQEVTITSDGSTVVIERGPTRWTLPEINSTYYPKFPDLGEELGRLPGEVLKDGLRRVKPCVAAKGVPEAIQILTGVEFTFGAELTLAALDLFRVATVELSWQPTLTTEDQALVIPEALLALPMDILSAEDVRVHSDGNLVGFVTDRHRVLGRLLDGAFRPWRDILPDADKAYTTVTVDTAALLGAVKDARAVAKEKGDHLRLNFDPGGIGVASCYGGEESAETSSALLEFVGAPISVWCKPGFLTDALTLMPETTVITFGKDPWPGIVLSSAGYRHLVGTLKTPAAKAWAMSRAAT